MIRIHGFTNVRSAVEDFEDGVSLSLQESLIEPNQDGDYLARTDNPHDVPVLSVSIHRHTPVAHSVRLLRKLADWMESSPEAFTCEIDDTVR